MKRSPNSEENILCTLKQAESSTPVGDVFRQMAQRGDVLRLGKEVRRPEPDGAAAAA
jgi:hypothetical protein